MQYFEEIGGFAICGLAHLKICGFAIRNEPKNLRFADFKKCKYDRPGSAGPEGASEAGLLPAPRRPPHALTHRRHHSSQGQPKNTSNL